MIFNKLIPELTVIDIVKTKHFYIDILGFTIEYEREADKFIFVSLDGSQFMFEEMHADGWNVATMEYPFGRGINFSIEVDDIDAIYEKLDITLDAVEVMEQVRKEVGIYFPGDK